MAVRRSKTIDRIRAGQALLTKIEKMKLVELERASAELQALEGSLISGLGQGSLDPRLGRVFADRVGLIRTRLNLLDGAMRQQSEKVVAQGAREKAAERVYERVLREEAQAEERVEINRIIEVYLGKTSLR